MDSLKINFNVFGAHIGVPEVRAFLVLLMCFMVFWLLLDVCAFLAMSVRRFVVVETKEKISAMVYILLVSLLTLLCKVLFFKSLWVIVVIFCLFGIFIKYIITLSNNFLSWWIIPMIVYSVLFLGMEEYIPKVSSAVYSLSLLLWFGVYGWCNRSNMKNAWETQTPKIMKIIHKFAGILLALTGTYIFWLIFERGVYLYVLESAIEQLNFALVSFCGLLITSWKIHLRMTRKKD